MAPTKSTGHDSVCFQLASFLPNHILQCTSTTANQYAKAPEEAFRLRAGAATFTYKAVATMLGT